METFSTAFKALKEFLELKDREECISVDNTDKFDCEIRLNINPSMIKRFISILEIISILSLFEIDKRHFISANSKILPRFFEM